VQELLRERGLPMCIEARALAAHQNYASLIGEWRTGHPYCRLMAADRARAHGWGRARRIAYGLAAPLAAPAVRLARLGRSLPGRRSLWPAFVAGLPAIVAMYAWDALGESLGYLLGPGNAERETLRWELETPRTRVA
jgi:hypothetical protein